MKKVLITGGTGLFGKEIIKGYLKKNYKVYFTSTSDIKIKKFLKKININKKKFLIPIKTKFNNVSDIKKFIDKYNKVGFNILINNARDLSNYKFKNGSYDEINNFNNEFFISISLPYLLSTKLSKKHLNSVINISSMYGVVVPNKNLYDEGYKNSPIYYGISKAAQIHLSKELSVRLIKYNIRVNSISFGGVNGRVSKNFKKKYNKLSPIGRMIKKEEIFEPIWFLSNEKLSSGTLGHNLVIDGGWSIW